MLKVLEGPKKRGRTLSGVTILSVMTKPLPCPGKCVYCPGGVDKEIPTPKSYLPKSPTVLRGIRNDYDSRKQIQGRIEVLDANGHLAEKCEVIVMGGTFMSSPKPYRFEFIKGIYDGLNGTISESLEEAKEINQTALHRCVGMCIETRPDWAKEQQIAEMLDFGTTRIELGVQIADDQNYELTKRGHTVKDVIEATKLLKDSGFKIYYHYMPNLPGANIEKDIREFERLFADQSFRPDGLKIYPCVVVEGTELEETYRKGEYVPYTEEEIVEVLARVKALVPKYVRIQRVMRDIPAQYIVGGSKFCHQRDPAKQRMKELGLKCLCIRCREVGYNILKGKQVKEENIKLNRLDYQASDGKEIFLSFDDMENDLIVALLRLRIPSKAGNGSADPFNPSTPFRKEITSTATIVRELHVFGVEKSLHDQEAWTKSFQHKGFGKRLLQEAEKITKDMGFNK